MRKRPLWVGVECHSVEEEAQAVAKCEGEAAAQWRSSGGITRCIMDEVWDLACGRLPAGRRCLSWQPPWRPQHQGALSSDAKRKECQVVLLFGAATTRLPMPGISLISI